MVFDARRAVLPVPDEDRSSVIPVDALGTVYPLTVQFLTLERYGNGEVRVPGSLTLFYDAGLLKGCLNDKDAGLAAFVSGAGLSGVLASIEEGLRGDKLDWRASKDKKGKRR